MPLEPGSHSSNSPSPAASRAASPRSRSLSPSQQLGSSAASSRSRADRSIPRWRGLGVLVVLTLLTTVLTPLLHRIAKAQLTTTEPSR